MLSTLMEQQTCGFAKLLSTQTAAKLFIANIGSNFILLFYFVMSYGESVVGDLQKKHKQDALCVRHEHALLHSVVI